MKFSEKKLAYQTMQSVEHVDADRALLQVKSPQSYALISGILDKVKAQREILWSLLDVATVEEIRENRKALSSREDIKSFKDLEEILSSDIKETLTKEEIIEQAEKILSLAEKIGEENIPDEMKKTLVAHLGYLNEVKKTIEESDAAEYRKALIKEILELDLVKAEQKTLLTYARALGLKTPDNKAATLRTLLEEYRMNLPKIGEADGVNKDAVPADINKTNVFESEKKIYRGQIRNNSEGAGIPQHQMG